MPVAGQRDPEQIKDALEQWRHYEPWLGPLRNALGPVLAEYPAVPAFTD